MSLSRRKIYEMGLTAAQCGAESPLDLQELIRAGVILPYRVELAREFIDEGLYSEAKMVLEWRT